MKEIKKDPLLVISKEYNEIYYTFYISLDATWPPVYEYVEMCEIVDIWKIFSTKIRIFNHLKYSPKSK